MSGFPLELISNFVSLIVVIAIFYRFFQYKKKMAVIQGLQDLKQSHQLKTQDHDFIQSNYQEYAVQLQKQEALIKFIYPIFILLAGVLIMLFSFSSALIHLNIIVVIFIYLHIVRIHLKNFVNLLGQLKE